MILKDKDLDNELYDNLNQASKYDKIIPKPDLYLNKRFSFR